jgi:hypothetical protein
MRGRTTLVLVPTTLGQLPTPHGRRLLGPFATSRLIDDTHAVKLGRRKHEADAVRTMAEVYGEAAGVVLMKDDAIRRAPAERDALAARNVRAFFSRAS